MALPIINFVWTQGKRILHNWSIPALAWNATAEKLYPIQVDDDGKLMVVGDLAITESTVTPTIVSVGASASGTIPSGAKGWTITFLTGSGTLGGVAVSAGFSDSDSKTTAAAISYTTNSASSAYVRYNS